MRAMTTLRQAALGVVAERDPSAKIAAAGLLSASLDVGTHEHLAEPPGLPGRPAQPVLVPHTQLKSRSVHTREGHAALLHSIAHIEFNAVDLAADIIWRFPALPDAFYLDWARVAREEARHFALLRQRLNELGCDYGDFPAHNALWDMAERTRGDLLARLALVPRTLEARGLDASPAVRAKLAQAGDEAGAAIIDIILREEIGHVAIGNHWYRLLCAERGLDPLDTAAALAEQHGAPRPRAPFNLDARRQAGFTEDELAQLGAAPSPDVFSSPA